MADAAAHGIPFLAAPAAATIFPARSKLVPGRQPPANPDDTLCRLLRYFTV